MTVYTLAFLVSFVLALVAIWVPGRHLVAVAAAITAGALLIQGVAK